MNQEHNLSIHTVAASRGQCVTNNTNGLSSNNETERNEKRLMKNNDDGDVASSPSNNAEEINFNLVYALYAFDSADKNAAIVDQDEPLTLLDDSHIDWWLVKVVKNNKIGYMPADYVEFPYEKLARLNRHRNVNVASSQNLTEQDHLDLMNKSKNAGEKQTREVKFKPPEIFVFTIEEDEEDEMEIVEEIMDSSDSKVPNDKVEEEFFEEHYLILNYIFM